MATMFPSSTVVNGENNANEHGIATNLATILEVSGENNYLSNGLICVPKYGMPLMLFYISSVFIER
jgi:hypothetical protein